MSESPTYSIDVRAIAPRDRHPTIFGQLRELQPGESLLLVNDHDPRPLYYQLQAQAPGAFTWTYLQSGPDVWQVNIGKTATTAPAAPKTDSCCSGGSCG